MNFRPITVEGDVANAGTGIDDGDDYEGVEMGSGASCRGGADTDK